MAAGTKFDRDQMASWYANQHLNIDSEIDEVFYLPKDAEEREIRLIMVNKSLPERLDDDKLEPIDYGVDFDSENQHKLLILDVSKKQWQQIEKDEIPLPLNWTLENKIKFPNR